MEKLLEVALREKLRFTYRGQLSIEDLWDLRLELLDDLHGKLVKASKEKGEVSLLKKETKEDRELEMRIKIVKHILLIKIEEKEAREQLVLNRKHNEKIDTLIAKKQDEELEKMSLEELKALRK